MVSSEFLPLANPLNAPSTPKSLKIAVITPDFSGGGVTRAYLLAQALRSLGHQVQVFGFQFGETVYPLPPAGLPIHPIPGGNYPKLFGYGRQLLSQMQADIIYAVKPKPTSFGVALLKQLQTRCPVILDIDDWELSWVGGDTEKYRPTPRQLMRDLFKPNGALRQPEHPLYLRWMEKLIPRANAITVDTRFLQTRFGGTYLPNGKDTEVFDPQRFSPEASRARYELADYRVLMFPGTARPHKGVEDVLMALEQLNEPDLRLVIVGGRKFDDYEKYLSDRWGDWMIKLPRFPVEAIAEVVAAAHVVVVPQRDTATAKAQFPLKLTDGMAMAKPILSTPVGDIPEILGDTGYLVQPDSPAAIATQIRWIFQNLDLANQTGQKARERCIERYSVKAMGQILSEVIQGLPGLKFS